VSTLVDDERKAMRRYDCIRQVSALWKALRAPACLRLLILMLPAVALLSGCAHPLGVSRTWEKTTVVQGTFAPDNAASKTLDVECSGLSTNGILSVQADDVTKGTQEQRVEVWGHQEYNPYDGFEWIAKPICTPIGIGLFGAIIWSPTLSTGGSKNGDHNGNGTYDPGEYLYDLSAWFNIFSAFPYDDNSTEWCDVVLRTRTETCEVTNRVPVPGCRIVGEIAAKKGKQPFSGRTDSDGKADIDLAPLLRGFVGADAQLRVFGEHSGRRTATCNQAVPAINICEVVRCRYGSRAFAELSGPEQDETFHLYRSTARQLWDRGAYKEALSLAGAAATLFPAIVDARELPTQLSGDEPMPLADAIRHGIVDAKVSGSGIRSVSVKITRNTPAGVMLAVPAGTYFVCGSSAQNMVGTERRTVDLRKRDSAYLSMPAACANMRRAVPTSQASFSVQNRAASADLQKLAPHLAGQSFAVKQAAVWIVTDNASRSDLNTLVSRPFGQVSGGKPVISDGDVLSAAKLIQKAGIDLSRKRIAGWVRTHEP